MRWGVAMSPSLAMVWCHARARISGLSSIPVARVRRRAARMRWLRLVHGADVPDGAGVDLAGGAFVCAGLIAVDVSLRGVSGVRAGTPGEREARFTVTARWR